MEFHANNVFIKYFYNILDFVWNNNFQIKKKFVLTKGGGELITDTSIIKNHEIFLIQIHQNTQRKKRKKNLIQSTVWLSNFKNHCYFQFLSVC